MLVSFLQVPQSGATVVRSKVRRSSMAFQETGAAFQNDSMLSLRNRIPTWNSVKLDIKAAICDKYGLDDASVIHVSKRNKKLECGDFLVVIPSMIMKCPAQTQSQTLRNQLRLVQSTSCVSSASGDEVKAPAAVETPMTREVGIVSHLHTHQSPRLFSRIRLNSLRDYLTGYGQIAHNSSYTI